MDNATPTTTSAGSKIETRTTRSKTRAQQLRTLKQTILHTMGVKDKQSVRWIIQKKEKIRVKRLSPQAKIPTKRSPQAAGFDLTAPYSVYIPPMTSRTIGLKIALQIPEDHYGRIVERSGLARHLSLSVLGGVIDADYRGEIFVILMNLGLHLIELPKHSRIAQLIVEKIHRDHELEEVEELNTTARNERRFGSTGTN